MPKEYDNFVELSLAEEEVISGGSFLRRAFRFATSKKTWRTAGQVLGTAVNVVKGGAIVGGVGGAIIRKFPRIF